METWQLPLREKYKVASGVSNLDKGAFGEVTVVVSRTDGRMRKTLREERRANPHPNIIQLFVALMQRNTETAMKGQESTRFGAHVAELSPRSAESRPKIGPKSGQSRSKPPQSWKTWTGVLGQAWPKLAPDRR